MKIFVAFFAVAFLFSCNNDNWWGDGPEPNAGIFSFKAKETRIVVSDEMKSFKLNGYLPEMADDRHMEMPNIAYIAFDEQKSTAKPGIHFINNPDTKFIHTESNEIYFEVMLIPENITEDVQIVYYAYLSDRDNSDNYPDVISETVITLHRETEK